MKKLLLPFAAFGFATLAFGGWPIDAHFDDFRQRAQAYIEVAALQMQTDRWELAALSRETEGAAERLAPVYTLVKRGEELVLRLRSALPTEFEAVRVQFERNRAEIDRALGRNRWTG